ncbi:MAG: hypothetical protein COA65_04520 [Rhodospirillaceae bacterium]|nr:MAG: hypothetical protein COA65_04520 [Rhodospirillaceae bacterium]
MKKAGADRRLLPPSKARGKERKPRMALAGDDADKVIAWRNAKPLIAPPGPSGSYAQAQPFFYGVFLWRDCCASFKAQKIAHPLQRGIGIAFHR